MKRFISVLLSALLFYVVILGLTGGIVYFFKVVATNSF